MIISLCVVFSCYICGHLLCSNKMNTVFKRHRDLNPWRRHLEQRRVLKDVKQMHIGHQFRRAEKVPTEGEAKKLGFRKDSGTRYTGASEDWGAGGTADRKTGWKLHELLLHPLDTLSSPTLPDSFPPVTSTEGKKLTLWWHRIRWPVGLTPVTAVSRWKQGYWVKHISWTMRLPCLYFALSVRHVLLSPPGEETGKNVS